MTLRRAAFGARVVDLMLASIAVVGLFVTAEQIAIGFQTPSCPTFDHGVYTKSNVPCSNATCVPAGYYPENLGTACPNFLPACDDGFSPDNYSATSATIWYNCHAASSPTRPSCIESCFICANVLFFRGTSCTIYAQCTKKMSTIQSCRTTQGNP